MSAPSAFLVTVVVDEANLLNLGRRYLLSPQGTTIGNVPDVDIPLRIDRNPNCHLRIHLDNDLWYLTDIADFSGASLNTLIVQNSQLFDSDILKIGSMGFEFCSGEGEKVQYFEQIESLLQEDFLTRAYNRSFLYNLLQIEIVRYHRNLVNAQTNKSFNPPSPLSILFVDLDHFGQINKQYGHAAGDEVLRELVRQIKLRLRFTDIIARYGGEEFVIVLLDTTKEQALTVAESMRELIESFTFHLGVPSDISVTVSIGVAMLQNGMNVDSLLKVADERMRKAKTKGRNCSVG